MDRYIAKTFEHSLMIKEDAQQKKRYSFSSQRCLVYSKELKFAGEICGEFAKI